MSALKLAQVTAAALAMAALSSAGASAQQHLKMGLAGVSVNFAPALIGVVKPEIYAKHNISVEITDFRGQSANCIAAVLADAVDVCQVSTATGTNALAEGADLKVLAALSGPLSEIIISKKAAEATGISLTAPADDRIKALKGLRITTAQPGAGHYLVLSSLLRDVGLDIEDIQYRTLGDTVAMIESIRNDQIDGSMWTAGQLGSLVNDGAGVRWISVAAGDAPKQASIPFVAVFAKSSWVDANSEVAEALHASTVDGIAYIQANKDEASSLIKARYFPDLDQGVWDDGFGQAVQAFYPDASVRRDGWDFGLQLQAEGSGKNYDGASYDKVVMPFAENK